MLDSFRCLPERHDDFGSHSCRTAFRRDRRLPASVFGPVLLSALLRLASICRNEVISLSSHRQFCRRSSPHRCLDQGSRRLGLAGTLALRLQTPSSVPPLIGMAVPLTRVCCHNLSATGTGSMESLPHHAT